MTREEEVVERLRAAGHLVKRIEMKGGVAPIATESALSAAEQAISEAAALIEQLVAERDALAQFARVMVDCAFDGSDMEGWAIQDEAQRLGLIEKTQYDPEKHGRPHNWDGDPGDDYFVITPLLRSRSPSESKRT